MYRCGFCGLFSRPGESQVKVVIETRPRTYDCRDSEGEHYQTIGYEIRRETSGHAACAEDAYKSESEAIRNVRKVAVDSKIKGNAIRIRRFLKSRAEEEETEES